MCWINTETVYIQSQGYVYIIFSNLHVNHISYCCMWCILGWRPFITFIYWINLEILKSWTCLIFWMSILTCRWQLRSIGLWTIVNTSILILTSSELIILFIWQFNGLETATPLATVASCSYNVPEIVGCLKAADSCLRLKFQRKLQFIIA